MRGLVRGLAIAVALAISSNVFGKEDIKQVDENVETISQYIRSADEQRRILAYEKIINERSESKRQGRSVKSVQPKHVPIPDREPIEITSDGETLSTGDNGIKISIPDNSSGKVRLSRQAKSQNTTDPTDTGFEVSLPNQANNSFNDEAKVALDNSVVYLNYESNTDVAVQAFDDSTRILTILNGYDSPSEYQYDVNVPSNGRIIKNNDGGIMVVDREGSLVGGFAPPWAIDNKGKEIPTYYEIRGDAVVQVVNHVDANPSYPVVADPWMYRNLISYAFWVRNPDGWTFSVKPTYWARINNGYYPAVAGWNELYSKYKNRGLNFNLRSMRDQYICHPMSQIAVLKSSWNLDEWRPHVGLWSTITAGCNP